MHVAGSVIHLYLHNVDGIDTADPAGRCRRGRLSMLPTGLLEKLAAIY